MQLSTLKNAILIGLAVSFISGCKPDAPPVGTLKINFVATANNQPFVIGNKYTTIDGLSCKYQNFKFYISNLQLYKQGVPDTVLDAAIINFNNDMPSKSVSIELPTGSYEGLGFGIGLDSLQNKVDPTSYPSSSPYSTVNGMYWGMGFKYRFIIIEGAIDTSDDGIDNFVQPISIHVGDNDLYKSVVFSPLPITINDGETAEIDINFDFNNLFFRGADTIHLKTNGITHTNDNFPLASKVAINFTNALHASH